MAHNGIPSGKRGASLDRKSTRLNSSLVRISYAVFCLKKKKYILVVRAEVEDSAEAQLELVAVVGDAPPDLQRLDRKCQLGSLASLYPFFFFNDTATTEIYTLSLHDALPISRKVRRRGQARCGIHQASVAASG